MVMAFLNFAPGKDVKISMDVIDIQFPWLLPSISPLQSIMKKIKLLPKELFLRCLFMISAIAQNSLFVTDLKLQTFDTKKNLKDYFRACCFRKMKMETMITSRLLESLSLHLNSREVLLLILKNKLNWLVRIKCGSCTWMEYV